MTLKECGETGESWNMARAHPKDKSCICVIGGDALQARHKSSSTCQHRCPREKYMSQGSYLTPLTPHSSIQDKPASSSAFMIPHAFFTASSPGVVLATSPTSKPSRSKTKQPTRTLVFFTFSVSLIIFPVGPARCLLVSLVDRPHCCNSQTFREK